MKITKIGWILFLIMVVLITPAIGLKGMDFIDTPNVSVYVGQKISVIPQNDAACQLMDASWTWYELDREWYWSVEFITDSDFMARSDLYGTNTYPSEYTIVSGDVDKYFSQLVYCYTPGARLVMAQLFKVVSGSPPPTYNITYTVKNLAGTSLQNINVRTVSDLTDTQYTTDVNGNITQQITLSDNTVTVSTTPTGYYSAYSEVYELTSNMSKTIYLIQSNVSSQEINVTYHITDIYNNSIESALVTHTINAQSDTWGYTDTNGNVTFNLVPVFNHAFYYVITKSGYQDYMRFFSFSGNPTEILINVTMESIGAIPTPLPTQTPPSQLIYTDINYYVKTFSGISISDALIEIFYHNQVFSAWNGLTDFYGFYKFNNIEHYESEEFDLKITKSGYNTYTQTFSIPNINETTLTIYLTPYVSPTPTPLPSESPYILTLSSTSVSYGGNVTATLSSVTDPTLALVNGIQYSYLDEGAWLSTDFFEPGTPALTKQYSKLSGTWKQFNTSVLYFSDTHSGIPNPDVLRFIGSSGTKTIRCTVMLTTGQYYELTGVVVVGQGAGYKVTRIQAIDGLGGGLIYYPEIDIYNKNTEEWFNGTYSSGAAEISTPANIHFDVYGIKAGYVNAMLPNIIVRDDITYELRFYTGVTPSAGNQSLSFVVTNINGLAIPGALVKIIETGTTTTFIGTTGTGGVYNPIVKQLTLYTYTVTKSGYKPGAGSFTTSAEFSDQWVHQLEIGAAPTATIPTTIPSGQPTPIVTQTGVPGNYTGFWAPMYKGLSGMGATSGELGILMTMFFVIFGCIGGAIVSHGEPRTTSACASAAFILSCAFGWIYFWIILAGICWLLASFFLFRE